MVCIIFIPESELQSHFVSQSIENKEIKLWFGWMEKCTIANYLQKEYLVNVSY